MPIVYLELSWVLWQIGKNTKKQKAVCFFVLFLFYILIVQARLMHKKNVLGSRLNDVPDSLASAPLPVL